MSESYDSDESSPRANAALFDMDGLLVDTEPLWLAAETAVMARLGADWTTEDQVQLLGGSLDRTVRYLMGKARRPASPEQVAEWLMSGIVGLVRDHGVPVQPGARELLADLLFELNDPAAALIEYEQSVGTERNRFRSILGIARAAKQTGDMAKARDAYGKLVTLASVDADRPELAEAKAFLAN